MTTLTPELRLLTYRPETMIGWWTALLDAQPQTLHPRITLLATPTLRVVIERSEIALDYTRDACGVCVISVMPGDPRQTLGVVDRLATMDSHPHRATCHPGHIRLWYTDPNGAEVTVDAAMPTDRGATGKEEPLFPDELDPAAVIATLRKQEAS